MKNQSLLAFQGGFRFLHLGLGAGGQHGELDLLEDAGFDLAAEGGAVAVSEEAFAVFVESFFNHQIEGKLVGILRVTLFADGFPLSNGQRESISYLS